MASALMVGAVACNKTPEPSTNPSDEPSDNPSEEPVPAEKSKACKILEFSVKGGDVVIEGQIFDEENYIELTYQPEQAKALSNAVATVKISDKATISPDPATITDWTKPVDLKVTAEDGTTAKTYSVEPAEVQYTVDIKKGVEKSAESMGAVSAASFGGNNHAFCATDKFADSEGNVFDLSLNKVGDLNVDALGNGSIVAMANDDNGVLIATVGYGDAAFSEACTGSDNILSTRIFAWKDGYDKAPTQIYENAANVAQYLNVSGDINGTLYAFVYAPGRDGKHHFWTFTEGKVSGTAWRWFDTKTLDNRPGDSCNGNTDLEYFYAGGLNGGVSSGQNVSAIAITPDPNDTAENPADRKPLGGIYVVASASPEWDGNTGGSWWRLGGSLLYVRNGADGENIEMPGALVANNLVSDPLKHAGPLGYGNTDFVANIKAFNYAGHNFAAIAHVGVVNAYFTVQNLDYYLNNEGDQYLLSTVQGYAEAPTNNKPSVAYVYDSATQEGHIVTSFILAVSDGAPAGYTTYTLTRKQL